MSPLNLSLTDESLQHRLSIGVTTKTGAKGSLTKCATLLLLSSRHENNDATATATSTSIRHQQASAINELHLEMQKLLLQMQSLESESNQLDEDQLTQQLQHERAAVTSLRETLHQSQSKQSLLLEYESLAQTCLQTYPIGVAELECELEQVEDELLRTKRETERAQNETNLRTAQFQSVLQGIMDLKQSLNEPVEVVIGNIDMGVAAVGDDDAMQVEPDDNDNGADDALYNDLL